MTNEVQKKLPSWPHAAVDQISKYLIEMYQVEINEAPNRDALDSSDREAVWDEVYEEFLTKLQINV